MQELRLEDIPHARAWSELQSVSEEYTAAGGDAAFWTWKRVVDVAIAVAASPLLLVTGLALFAANPMANPGPLLYRQRRMGLEGRPFVIVKFRTMRPGPTRGAFHALERGRITPLGRILRRSRVDELPQLWNVLRGEMSLIGPRPDYFEHAVSYVRSIPGYRARLVVRPGISGLAQVRLGYAEGVAPTVRKVRFDRLYIRNACWRMELRIMLETLRVLATGAGAR